MTQMRNKSKRYCNHCSDPKPLLTDKDFYNKHPTKCKECVKKHNREYLVKKKLEREGQPPQERDCNYCPVPKPKLTDSDFYGIVGRRCKNCTLNPKKGLSKDEEDTGTLIPAKTIERSLDSNELHGVGAERSSAVEQSSTAGHVALALAEGHRVPLWSADISVEPNVTCSLDLDQGGHNQRIRELEEELQTYKDQHVRDLEEQIRLLKLLAIRN